jgi:hypothetical protein
MRFEGLCGRADQAARKSEPTEKHQRKTRADNSGQKMHPGRDLVEGLPP